MKNESIRAVGQPRTWSSDAGESEGEWIEEEKDGGGNERVFLFFMVARSLGLFLQVVRLRR